MTSEVSTADILVKVSIDERTVKLPKSAFVALVNEFHDKLQSHVVIPNEDHPKKMYL